MKTFVCLLSVFALAQGSNTNRIGWSSTTPAPLPPTTTPGWQPPPTEAPTTLPPAGWQSAPPSSISTAILLDASLAAGGIGDAEAEAAQAHAENVVVSGNYQVPAEISMESFGEAIIVQEGSITQISQVDPDNAIGINAVDVDQGAGAENEVSLVASGLSIANAQSAQAYALGGGVMAAGADTTILVAQS